MYDSSAVITEKSWDWYTHEADGYLASIHEDGMTDEGASKGAGEVEQKTLCLLAISNLSCRRSVSPQKTCLCN